MTFDEFKLIVDKKKRDKPLWFAGTEYNDLLNFLLSEGLQINEYF